MTTEPRTHWEKVYTDKSPDSVSWFRPHLEQSMRLLKRAGLTPSSTIIDVGGGASTLVDDLLDLGCAGATVLDISEQALRVAQNRLGARAADARWIAADITKTLLPAAAFDLWHDRAVFHFLTEAGDREKYRAALTAALRRGGHAVIATFSREGPPRCSGLDVCRYDAVGLAAELGTAFTLVESTTESHVTPGGKEQAFLYCLFEMIAPSS